MGSNPTTCTKMNTKHIGDIAEAAVTLKCLQKEWEVAKPVGDNCAYDLILNRGNGFEKVQVKHGHLVNGCVKCSLDRVRQNSKGTIVKPYTNKEVDTFAVYCSELNTVYLVPFTDKAKLNLRVESAKSNQQANIVFASNYLIVV